MDLKGSFVFTWWNTTSEAAKECSLNFSHSMPLKNSIILLLFKHNTRIVTDNKHSIEWQVETSIWHS